MALRPLLVVAALLLLAAAPPAAAGAASFDNHCGDGAAVPAGSTRTFSCTFECDGFQPAFFLVAGTGGAFRFACQGGADATCTPGAVQPCFLDFTGFPTATGRGTCSGTIVGPAAYVAHCGAVGDFR